MILYLVVSIIIGLATGLLSGVFGVGGRILSTPAIRLILDVPPLIAIGTTLPVVIPTVATGGMVYWRRGLVEKKAVIPTGLSGFAGMIIGSLSTSFISGSYLLILTAVVILLVGLRFIYCQFRGVGLFERLESDEECQTGRAQRHPLASFILIGLVAGLLAGLLGISGGIIIVPAYVFIMNMPVKKAFGTSLVVMIMLATPGSIIHLFLGHVDIGLALLLIIGVVPGAYLGARLAYMAKSRYLSIGFGIFLTTVAMGLGITEVYQLISS